MIDKEILIKGVDVSECRYIDEWKHCKLCKELIKTKTNIEGKPRTTCLTTEDLECAYYDNCYYKQLARKTEELRLAEQLITKTLEQFGLQNYDWQEDQNEISTELMDHLEEFEKLKEQFRTFTDIHNATVKQYEALKKQYITVLDLAKKNSDSYEYCLKSLEEKIERLENDSKKN